MRKRLASFLLIASVVVWGIWCGGQYFNEARVIPKKLSNPPESVAAYNAIPTNGDLPFFFPGNPLIFLVSLAATIAAWRWARRSRKWLALSTVIGFGVCLALVLYLAPLIWSIDLGLDKLSAAEVITRAEAWKFGNRIRLIVEMVGFVCSVMALRVWSAEAAETGGIRNEA
ncbi:MAG TPA: hypothetical protein VEZ40_04175 [Pyrinomonadaceae bacterium]|nr:hypothetical protein [Pyrinomonadaceae bacterium]